jgi:hypothetical protein
MSYIGLDHTSGAPDCVPLTSLSGGCWGVLWNLHAQKYVPSHVAKIDLSTWEGEVRTWCSTKPEGRPEPVVIVQARRTCQSPWFDDQFHGAPELLESFTGPLF